MHSSVSKVLERTGEYFMKQSPIHAAARRVSDALQEMKIPFAIVGALATNVHGHVRTTQDVNILTSAEGLAQFKQAHIGRGWVNKFEGSRGMRDTVNDINIDVLLTGDFPGDGKSKPVSFPDAATVAEINADGIPVISLNALLELKIASGMTTIHRPRDLDDVIQLIRVNKLPIDHGESLNLYVQAKFAELWSAAQINEDY
ncbi:hypothetical protein ACFL2H_11505 [Planctomycetota bacterium]